MRAKVKEYALENIRLHLQEILEIKKDKELLIRKIKEIIPEYKSMNSRYQNLDE